MFQSKRGFTLIELLVVVLIIAILVSIALPKYQTMKDKALVASLITIGESVANSLDRYSLMDNSSSQYPAMNRLDIVIKNKDGGDCGLGNINTAASCQISIAGKGFGLYPASNYGSYKGNTVYFYSNKTTGTEAFGSFTLLSDKTAKEDPARRKYNLRCSAVNSGWMAPIVKRCERLGESFGARCSSGYCRWD